MYVCRIAISKSKTTKGYCVCIFIVMTADDLVTGGPRASANIMFSEKKNMCTVAFLFHFRTLNQWMFSGTALSTCSKTRIRCKVYNFNVVFADVLVTGTTGAFAGIIFYQDCYHFWNCNVRWHCSPKKGNIMQYLHFVMLWLLMTYWNVGPRG